MMRYIFFLFLLLCIPFFVKAQKGYRLVYDLTYQIDSTDTNSIQNELFYLDMFGNESYFVGQDKFVMDSFLINVDEAADANVLVAMANRPKMPRSNYILSKKVNTIKHYELFLTTKAAYEEEINFDWQLSEDTLQIGNYICQKATTSFAGREYTAWYTTKIPLTAAPYKFNGILGTVMRIVDSKNHYQFDLLEIQSVEKSNVYKLVDKQELVQKKDFLEIDKKMKENPYQMFLEFGFQPNEESREKMRKKTEARLKRENNPIELE